MLPFDHGHPERHVYLFSEERLRGRRRTVENRADRTDTERKRKRRENLVRVATWREIKQTKKREKRTNLLKRYCTIIVGAPEGAPL